MAHLDRFIDAAYLDDLQQRSLEEMREMRTECEQVENDLSYVRRLAHGRIDLVGGELDRRRRGAPPSDATELLDELPELLAEKTAATGLPRPPQSLGPSPDADDLLAELDAIATTSHLVALSDVDDATLASLFDALQAFETTVSAQRRDIQQVIDTVQQEIARRYRTGEASVDSLLG